MHEQHCGGVLKYLHEIGGYKEKFKEESTDNLQKIINKYEESRRSKWENIFGTPSKIAAIQTILEKRALGDKK